MLILVLYCIVLYCIVLYYDYFLFFSLVNISNYHSIYFQFTMVYFSYNTVPEEPLWEGPKLHHDVCYILCLCSPLTVYLSGYVLYLQDIGTFRICLHKTQKAEVSVLLPRMLKGVNITRTSRTVAKGCWRWYYVVSDFEAFCNAE